MRAGGELVRFGRGLTLRQDHIPGLSFLDVQPVRQSGLLTTQDGEQRADHLIDVAGSVVDNQWAVKASKQDTGNGQHLHFTG